MRNKSGKYIKKENNTTIHFTIPTLKDIFFWIIICFILFPWLAIGARFHVLRKVIEFFENCMFIEKEAEDSPKKNGLFY